MHASKIQQYEDYFFQHKKGNDGRLYKLDEFTIPIPDIEDTFSFTKCRPADGDESYYFNQDAPKNQIVLHFTGGYLTGDIYMLTRPNKQVSVPFLLSRSGIVLSLHPSAKWAYHLGPGCIGGNTTMSSQSVPIEISNIGPLKRIGDNLVTTYSDKDIYCSLDETQYYVHAPFRGFDYYAALTDIQYTKLANLIRWISHTYNIPMTFLPESERFKATELVTPFKGITTHINYRDKYLNGYPNPNGYYDKFDFGPQLDYARLQALLS